VNHELKTLVLAVVVAVLVASCASTHRLRSSAATGVSSNVVATTFNTKWKGFCDHDFCSVPILAQLTLRAPSGGSQSDAIISLTFDFETSLGDSALVSAAVFPAGQSGSPLPPGAFFVQSPSPGALTSTTVSWVITGLASGQTYTIQVQAAARDADSDGRALVHGTKGTLSGTLLAAT
jgi:hypothetical protein